MLHIRSMNSDDVPRGMKLKDQAGWNQTPADWQRLLALRPEGCFVALWEGSAVGTACVTVFGPVAWISMVLVDTAYRGRGIGTRLMEHALAYLDREKIRTVRLDATSLGRPIYARLGFVEEYEVIRWEGTAENAGSPIGQEGGSLAICPTAREQLDAIAELDLRATGTPRGVLLDRLHREWPEAMQIAMVEGRIVGYSYVRPGSRAWQVGPVITFDAASGEALLDRAFHDHGGQPIHLDVPRENLPAMHWAESHGLRIQRPFIRMRRGHAVLDAPDQLWASFGPEKG